MPPLSFKTILCNWITWCANHFYLHSNSTCNLPSL